MFKQINLTYNNSIKYTKYFLCVWLFHPILDYIFSRINLGISINLKFSLIFFPVEINYSLGKTFKYITDSDI
jgi:hypothetical protein